MSGTQPNNDVLLWGRVQKVLSQAQRVGDGIVNMLRMGSYGELVYKSIYAKQAKLAEEGSYFITRSPTPNTGIATTASLGSYADTTPFLIVSNNNPSGGRNIFLDYIKLTCTAAGNGTTLNYATKIDSTMRWSSAGAGGAGTFLTTILLGPYPTNTAAPVNSNALVFAGAVTATSSSSNARTLSNGWLRSVVPVVNDVYYWNFSGVDQMLDGVLISGTNVVQRCLPHSPVMISPQGSFLLYLWLASQSSASSYEVEVGHIER